MPLRETRLLVVVGIITLVVGIALIVFLEIFQRPALEPVPPVTIREVGPPSAEVEHYLELNRHFDALVSYTGERFEPDEIVIPEGGIVRFMNNAHSDIWIQEIGNDNAILTPNTSSCSNEVFGKCHPLKPGEFWESTFYATGTIQYINTLSATPRAMRINIR